MQGGAENVWMLEQGSGGNLGWSEEILINNLKTENKSKFLAHWGKFS